jgi:hypothetical protein
VKISERSLWVWSLAGAFDLIFAVTAIAIAVMNQRSGWIGGPAWTFALGGLAFFWLLGAHSHLRRGRR